jgi:hypothetical protein
MYFQTLTLGNIHIIRNTFFGFSDPPPSPFVTKNHTNPYIFTRLRNKSPDPPPPKVVTYYVDVPLFDFILYCFTSLTRSLYGTVHKIFTRLIDEENYHARFTFTVKSFLETPLRDQMTTIFCSNIFLFQIVKFLQKITNK